MKKSFILGALSVVSFVSSQGFLKTDGQKIVNEEGENVVLKGLGLGGWMLQEGYMLKTAEFAGPQHKIEEKITEVAGIEGKNKFYKEYLKNGITKADIDSLAKWGFNSVRLPMHYKLYTLPVEKEPVKGKNTWLDEGFKMTDDLLKWCTENKIYLILDLHAVPGGQGKDANISDYEESKPSVWESEENQKKTIALWKKLAERYKNEAWIAGYDIINEPNWNFSGSNLNGCDEKNNAPLRKLQVEITKAIREVDQKHIIFIEGNCWGNNYNGMFPLWDNNLVLSFHKYWSNNDDETIQQMLDYRTKYNVAIWLGETGENSNVWFTELIQLMDKHNIGWAFWPMKKIDNIAGITNVKSTPEYQQLLDYWQNGGQKPTQEFAEKTLLKIADRYKIKNVEVKKDVIDAMFRQVQNSETIPFKKQHVPGKIYAAEYDLGRLNSAYYDNDIMNLWVSDPTNRSEWNSGNEMRNDGVDIYKNNDSDFSYYISKIEPKEWLQYTFESTESGTKNIKIEFRNKGNASKIIIKNATNESLADAIIPYSGNSSSWSQVEIKNILLQKGENKLRFYFVDGNFDFKSFSIE